MMRIVFNERHVGERKATAREALDAFFAAYPAVRELNLDAGGAGRSRASGPTVVRDSFARLGMPWLPDAGAAHVAALTAAIDSLDPRRSRLMSLDPVSPFPDPTDHTNRAELVAILARLRYDIPPPHIVADVLYLARLGRRARRHAERLCSDPGYVHGRAEDFDAKTLDRIGAQATPVAAKYGLAVRAGGDPRGYAFHLVQGKNRIHGNTCGGDKDGYGLN